MGHYADFRRGLPIFFSREVRGFIEILALLLYALSLVSTGLFTFCGTVVAATLHVSQAFYWALLAAALYFSANTMVWLYYHIVRLSRGAP